MRTLNEQIQRLRDALVTCYNAIKRKGGTIPEAGDRTLLNMPAAVLSIPQSHGVLAELEVTANGEYLPAYYDADGFSKVTAEFDTSSLPKVNVSAFKVTNDCINEDGRWEGERLIDTSNVTDFQALFQNTSIINLDASGWNTSNAIKMRWIFANCRNLQYIDVTGWDISKLESSIQGFNGCFINCNSLKKIEGINTWITNSDSILNAESLFGNCSNLENLDLNNWNISISSASSMFGGCTALKILNVGNFIMDNCQSINSMFATTSSLKTIDLTRWKAGNMTNVYNFLYYSAITSLVGGKSKDEIIDNDICVLDGIKINVSISGSSVDTASILALVNGLADLIGQTAQTLTLGSTIGARLDTEEIAGMPAKEYLASKAAEKNWTIAY